MKLTKLTDLIGKTFNNVGALPDNSGIWFQNEDELWYLCHKNECCESVNLIDFDENELTILQNIEILDAEERTKGVEETSNGGETQWTFYSITTTKGTVDLRFYGESNGYYSLGAKLSKKENTFKLVPLIGKHFSGVGILGNIGEYFLPGDETDGIYFENDTELWYLRHEQQADESVRLVNFNIKELNKIKHQLIIDATCYLGEIIDDTEEDFSLEADLDFYSSRKIKFEIITAHGIVNLEFTGSAFDPSDLTVDLTNQMEENSIGEDHRDDENY